MSKPSIYFGVGSLAELETLFPDRGFHILRIPEISDAHMRAIRNSLRGRILSEVIYQEGMPDTKTVESLQNDFWGHADGMNAALLGIGGGSVMDVAKVLRFKPDGKDWLSKHLDLPIGDQTFTKMPLLLASTTAGTGSEVTPTATIWDFQKQCKHSFFGSQVLADVAIIDPRLCIGAPWLISRDAAIDALSHALEAIWNRNRAKETDDLAIYAAQKICHYLPLLRDDLNNLEYRQALSASALSAGMAMAKTQTALAHALSYEQTMTSKMSHGQSCAYWLPYVWQLLIDSDCEPEILISINRAIGEYFSTPTEMQEWLLALGFSVLPPLNRDKTVQEQVNMVRLSARGKNFAGFCIDDE
jgi:alcohol dehydrogenase class IV